MTTLCSAGAVLAQPAAASVDIWAQFGPDQSIMRLQGHDRRLAWIDVEALVWGGIAGDFDQTGDAVIATLRLRDPEGRAELRAGRFIFSTGAIRPLHLDGASTVARAPWGMNVEAFGGAPVQEGIDERNSDWVVGTRLSQRIADRATLGASFYHRRDYGARADEEAGFDFALAATDWWDLAATVAIDTLTTGLADAQASTALRSDKVRVELFFQQRSAMRILPATSLFTVLGEAVSIASGATVRWDAAPRLDTWLSLLVRHAQDDVGYEVKGRARLWLDDQKTGSVEAELRRQDVANARWTGLHFAGAVPFKTDWRLNVELELVIPDEPDGRGKAWPWGRVGLRYRPSDHWVVAAAGEASSSPTSLYDLRALVHASYTARAR